MRVAGGEVADGMGRQAKGMQTKNGSAAWPRAKTLIIATVVTVPTLHACSGEPSFEVGDCVRIEQGLRDSDLVAAECEGARGTFDPMARVYKVNNVIDGTGGGCESLQGFFPVEFVHEPDDVTYCLVQASG